jgi:hypothetical protein
VGADLQQVFRRQDVHALDQRGLGSAFQRQDEGACARCRRLRDAWRRTWPACRAPRAVAGERQLAGEFVGVEFRRLDLPEAIRMPSAIGRSKRPDSLGRSAGARLTVMRRWGNSKPQFWIAARTRSRASLHFGVGQADQGECRQAGGEMDFDRDFRCGQARQPSRAENGEGHGAVTSGRSGGSALAASSSATRASSACEFGPGASQHFALHVEFLAGHQIKLGEQAGQRGTQVLLDLAGGRRLASRVETRDDISSSSLGLSMGLEAGQEWQKV